jgi:hypothetical protein
VGTRGAFPGVKWSGRESDHLPPSSAEVNECVELYTYSPHTPSRRGAQLKKHRDKFTFTYCLYVCVCVCVLQDLIQSICWWYYYSAVQLTLKTLWWGNFVWFGSSGNFL